MTIYLTPRIVYNIILAILLLVAVIYLILVLKNFNENLKVTKRILDKTELTINDVSDKVTDTLDIFDVTKENILLYLGVVGEVIRAFISSWRKKDS